MKKIARSPWTLALIFGLLAGYIGGLSSNTSAFAQATYPVWADGSIHQRGRTFRFGINDVGFVTVGVFDEATGELLGTPCRFKFSNSGNRVAMDEPGVDPSYFATDPQTGTITDG